VWAEGQQLLLGRKLLPAASPNRFGDEDQSVYHHTEREASGNHDANFLQARDQPQHREDDGSEPEIEQGDLRGVTSEEFANVRP
jgi:hypothetical protein